MTLRNGTRRQRRRRALGGLLCAATVAALPASASAQSTPTRIVTDGTLPGRSATTVAPGGGGDLYVIDEDLGVRAGQNLFHSFEFFDVGEGDTARFTANSPVENLISRVTGRDPSRIDGTIEATANAGTANFLFLNPNGVLFGPRASVNVPGSLHVSTADELRFANPAETFSAVAPTNPMLSIASPEAFGFLDADVAGIEIAPQVGGARLEVLRGRDLSLVGGDLTIDDALVSAMDGDVRLVAVASAGEVRGVLGATEDIVLQGFDALGDVTLRDGAIVSSGAISPRFTPAIDPMTGDPTLTPPDQLSGLFIGADGDPTALAELAFVVGGQAPQPGDVVLSDGPTIDLVLRPRARPADGAGRIAIHADDLTIVDASVQALNPGDGDGGAIDVVLSGSLSIERNSASTNVGLLAETGYAIAGEQTFIDLSDGQTRTVPATLFVGGSGDGGDIKVRAADVALRGGGEISTTTFSAGNAGDVTLDVDGAVVIEGSTPDDLSPSALFSSTQGGGDGGDVTIRAADLRLADQGSIISQTTTDGDAGDVSVEVERLVIEGRSQIDSSTSAQSLDAPRLFVGREGDAGDVTIRASESITLVGDGASISGDFANVRSSSQAQSLGDAGRLRLETPRLTMDRTAGIEVVTRGAGRGGEIVLDVGALTMDGESYVSGRSFAAAGAPELEGRVAGDAGNILLGPADGLQVNRQLALDGGSEIVTSAVSAEGGNITLNATGTVTLAGASGIDASDTGGEGGNVLIPDFDASARPASVVVNEGSRILARAAVAGGDGGVIRIAADQVFVSADSVIDAENQVLIDSPDTNLESGLARPASAFLDASSLVRPSCAARGGETGRFSVATARPVPIAPDDLLVAATPFVTSPPTADVPGARGADAAGASPTATAGEGGLAGALDRLLRAARDEQRRGAFGDSLDTLRGALERAEATGDRRGVAASLGQLVETFMALGELDEAERLLELATEEAEALDDPRLRAELGHVRGNLELGLQRVDAALAAFDATWSAAATLRDDELAARALANAARAALLIPDRDAAATRLDRALDAQAKLAPGDGRARLRLHLARSLEILSGVATDATRATSLRRAHALLRAALEDARTLGDAYLESHALGQLGELYLSEGRHREALHLTGEAIARAEATGATDARARWSWQQGRLLWAQGRVDAALDAMETAVRQLEAARQAIVLQQGPASTIDFKREVAPIYLDLTQRLLEASDLAATGPDRDALLRRARGVVELFKAAELRDYFRDPCVADLAARTVSPETVGGGAAVVYPIVLPDRLELLVTLPSGIRRYTVAVDEATLTADLREFRLQVQGYTRRYRRAGQRLHDALVGPYRAELEAESIETIVFVPDGALRTLPLAALWDGKQYMIERYAVSVTPTLEVVDPRALDADAMNPLLVGVSEAVADYSPLPAVAAELASVHERIGGRVLLNAAFAADRFAEAVRRDRPDVIHIASHARFEANPQDSFLLAYDGPLGFDRFGEIIRSTRFRDEPIELLVLSACETATGNDRAALGLAGLAIRSGARSAIGSLWRVNDVQTARLFDAFYRALDRPGVSRAEALRTAQRAMIRDAPTSGHPRDWAAFLLVSNWL